jgi:hypothetical protein
MRVVILAVMVTVTVTAATAVAQASPRRARSGARRASLLELYTSEGCSSCPPADEQIDSLAARSPAPFIALAFHVDYWDEIGWPDRFASPRWSARQRARSASLYTPELMLDGREASRGRLLPAPSSQPARAQLELEIDGAQVKARASGGRRLFVAVTESGLVVHVAAGENRGRTLRHDHVVRELYGPFDAGRPLLQTIALEPGWNRAQLALVAFVEDDRGEVLNAVRLPLAP